MKISETAEVLTKISAFDRRTLGEADVTAWHEIIGDVERADALEAVRRWYSENTEWMMPAHVRRLVGEILKERAKAATATPWAPGQYGVLKADAMPEVSGPVDENALTPSVRALLDSVRAMLPEGSRETLMPRRVAWEREHAAYRRTQEAQPNPLYRPSVSGYSADQVWVDEMVPIPAEDHSRCIDPTCPCNGPLGNLGKKRSFGRCVDLEPHHAHSWGFDDMPRHCPGVVS